MNLISSLLLLLYIILIHELGHYVVMLKYNMEPYFKFKWFGMFVQIFRKRNDTTINKELMIAFTGILLPIPILILVNEFWLWIAYLVSLCIDIPKIATCFYLGFRKGFNTILTFNFNKMEK